MYCCWNSPVIIKKYMETVILLDLCVYYFFSFAASRQVTQLYEVSIPITRVGLPYPMVREL